MNNDIELDSSFNVGKVSLDAQVQGVIKRWADTHPGELVLVDRMMKTLRDKRRGGVRKITQGKHGSHVAEIPYSLNLMLQAEVEKDWLILYEIRNLVFAHFQVGMMERCYEYMKR